MKHAFHSRAARRTWRDNRAQRGFAVLSYTLATLVLLGITAAVVLVSSNRSSNADQQWVATSKIIAQANLLRQKILDCAGQNGNNGTSTHSAYPLGSAIDQVTTVALLTCPYSSQNLFSGTDGVFLPPAPTGFATWQYLNSSTAGVQLQLTATTFTGYASVFAKVVQTFGSSASTSGNTFTLVIAQ